MRAAAPNHPGFFPAPLNAPRAAARAGPRTPSPPPPARLCDASTSAAPAPRRGRPLASRRRPASRSETGPAAAWRREARGGPGGREERARLRLLAPVGPPRAEAQGRPRAKESGGGARACGGRREAARRAAATLCTAARAQRCVRRGLARCWGIKAVWAQALLIAVGCALSNPKPRWCLVVKRLQRRAGRFASGLECKSERGVCLLLTAMHKAGLDAFIGCLLSG